MVLPVDIHQSHHDPLVVLPLPSPLPASPLPSLPDMLAHLDAYLSGNGKVPAPVLTARMRQMNRDAFALLNGARVDAADSRAELDRRDTVLRGVEYERNRIREEIERCMEYTPAYTAAELPSLESFLESSPEVKESLPEPDSEEYEYAVIIAQLEQELKDIQAREADVAALTKDRDSLARAKKEIKKQFDSTETWLTDYSRSTSVLLSRLKQPLKIEPPVLSSLTISISVAAATSTPEDDHMDTA